MKIRNGFISNSSSTSFIIPTGLLKDDEKEILLSLDEDKEYKKILLKRLDLNLKISASENSYSINKEYHKILQKMIDDGEWQDSDWSLGEYKEDELICGNTCMWNGSIGVLMKKIGVDTTIFQIINHGHGMVHMATHPEAVKFFIKMNKKHKDEFEELNDEDKKMEIEFGHQPSKIDPYELSDNEFEFLGENSLIFENEEDDYSYVKDVKNED